MQSHSGTIKKYGHNRRPSIGKSMPISALLLNFTPNRKSSFDKIGQDGLSTSIEPISSPWESERPPLIFDIVENVEDNDNRSVIDNNAEEVTKCINKKIIDKNITDEEKNLINQFLINEQQQNHNFNIKPMLNKINLNLYEIEDMATSSQQCMTSSHHIKKITDNNKPMLLPNTSTSVVVDGDGDGGGGVAITSSALCTLICDKNCKLNLTKKLNKNIINNETMKFDDTTLSNNDNNLSTNKNKQLFLSNMINESDNKSINLIDTAVDVDVIDIVDNQIKNVGENNNVINDKNMLIKDRITDALVKTSMLTSPAARRRLAARKIEFDLMKQRINELNGKCATDADNNNTNNNNIDYFNRSSDDDDDYVPPKDLLMYLVRMGSFNSAPKINNCDSQDDDTMNIPYGLSTSDLLEHCKLMRGIESPQLLTRYFLKASPDNTSGLLANGLADGLRVLQLYQVSRVCSPPTPKHIRVLQWNILSQSLGQNNDGFICCPDEALTWESRKYLIIQEIIQCNPDIICLQEVDHFKFLQYVLGTQNYEGIFYPKPDSPCLYINENNGPDGCAIFFKKNKFEMLNYDKRILEVWKVQSNQVAIGVNFKLIEDGTEFFVCTTHLKARTGALLSKLRNEQGKDLIRFAHKMAQSRPIIICGDFNAIPNEPVYSTILNYKPLNLSSAYADLYGGTGEHTLTTPPSDASNANNFSKINCNGTDLIKTDSNETLVGNNTAENVTKSRIDKLVENEPPFTTWKIREDGEVCHTIDYIFYSANKLKARNCLMFPKEIDIGKNRTPSFKYPSDHFSLVCDFQFKDTDQNIDGNYDINNTDD